MSLIEMNIPSPKNLRGGWAALAAVYAARGWGSDVYATENQWCYHDGGGNWICLRFKNQEQCILIGHDHEYTETYYGKAAEYFGEQETNILEGAPDWWSFDLSLPLFGEWIGFVYGWDGEKWQRVNYSVNDGYEDIDLLEVCSINATELLSEYASDAPGLGGQPPSAQALAALVAADGEITPALLEAVVPGWDIEAGVAAARKFI
ncbi:proteophosphoglycan 5 [Alkalimonas sp. NCh-2]|uniref:proteophosphoglycan 5 n=1 Tax=Alkalimonas sp. NCh-2 TaxID=3144846 RepID=UPI0031F65F0A